MKKVLVVRYGEIALKGLNRPQFENKLADNMKRAIRDLGSVTVSRSQSRIYIESDSEEYPYEEALERLVKVFGIVSVSVASKVESAYEAIREEALSFARKNTADNADMTFKVEVKRGNKKFPMESPQAAASVGEYILDNIPSLKVDVKNPDFTVYIEIREKSYVYDEKVSGYCGMPLGTNGRGLLLLSGGIDSPVAGWMMAKRGVSIEALHFATPPYTGERAMEKVKELCGVLAGYMGHIKLHVVSITEPMMQIAEKCPEEETILHMRRLMMRVAEKMAKGRGIDSIITGESIGQVASQTMQAINVTNSVVSIPVFRPLIAMDKNEAITIARKIGSFDISTQPFEDCCTVFVAKHPATKPRLEKIERSEAKLDTEALVDAAIATCEEYDIR